MRTSQAGNSVIWIAVVAVIIGAALIGYGSVQSGDESATPHIHENGDTSHTHEQEHAPDAHNHNSGDAHAASPEEEAAAAAVDLSGLAPHADDIIIGDANAPVRIVEYASLSCPHCATMHLEILPDVKKKFVETGKAYIAFRHFPLNAPALRAAQVLNCLPVEQKAAALDAFFTRQKEWGFDSKYAANITKIAGEFGLSADATKACFDNVELENAILQSRQVGALAGVQSTPTLYVNNARLDGAVGADFIAAAIEEALNPTAASAPQAAAVASPTAAQEAAPDGDKPKEITQE